MLLHRDETLLDSVFRTIEAYSDVATAQKKLKARGIDYTSSVSCTKGGDFVQKVRLVQKRSTRNDYIKTVISGTIGSEKSELTSHIYRDAFSCAQTRTELYDCNCKLTKAVIDTSDKRIVYTYKDGEKITKEESGKTDIALNRTLKVLFILLALGVGVVVIQSRSCKGKQDNSYQRM